jgi:hypothetical protein
MRVVAVESKTEQTAFAPRIVELSDGDEQFVEGRS